MVYNNFNEATILKITNFLKELNIVCNPITLGEESFFSLIYTIDGTKHDFANHMRLVISKALVALRIQLITVDIDDVIGLVTSNYPEIHPLGLTIKNVPFLNTKHLGEFVARPKNLAEFLDVMRESYSNDKFELIHSEFGLKLENNQVLIVTIEKMDRLSIVNAKTSPNTLTVI